MMARRSRTAMTTAWQSPMPTRNTTGHQVALDVGATVIDVVVTSEDTSFTAFYPVTVTRRAPLPTPARRCGLVGGV